MLALRLLAVRVDKLFVVNKEINSTAKQYLLVVCLRRAGVGTLIAGSTQRSRVPLTVYWNFRRSNLGWDSIYISLKIHIDSMKESGGKLTEFPAVFLCRILGEFVERQYRQAWQPYIAQYP